MAQFPAEILLTVNNSQAIKNIAAVEKSLNKIKNIKLSPFERNQKVTAKAEAEISKQLDVQAQKYAAIERLQRQLTANDNSRIKALQKQNKVQQFIQDKVSQGRIRRQSAATRGDANAYPTTIGPTPDFERRNQQLKDIELKTKRIAAAEERLNRTREQGVGRKKQFIQLQEAENKAILEAARTAAQAKGEEAVRLKEQKRFSAEKRKQVNLTKAAIAAAQKQARITDRNLKRIQQETKERQKQLRLQQKQSQKRFENIALGVGFPLLFGGGAGSVLGGGLGSFAGEGFGGQILGSAIGQGIDDYVQGLTKLAQSLESTQGILDGLEEAGYKVSDATKGVIKSYEDAGLVAEAYQLAIGEINRVLGPDGAAILSDYRIETENLSQEFSNAKAALDAELIPALTGTIRLILGLKSAFDILAESPLLKLLGGVPDSALDLSGSAGNLFKFGKLTFEGLQQLGATTGEVEKPNVQKRAEELEIEKRITKTIEDRQKAQEKQNRVSDAARADNAVLKERIKAIEAGTDLTKENVFLARQQVIETRFLNDLTKAGTNADAKKNAELKKRLALTNLNSQREAALARANKKASSGRSGVDKEAQVQKAIANQLTKQFELETKIAKVGVTKLEKLDIELERLDQKKALQEQQIALGTEDARIKQVKLQNLNLQTNLLRQQLELQRERVLIEKAINVLRGEQELEGLQRGLDQELAQITLPTGNPFEDERNELALKQQQRYINTIAEVNDAIKIQQTLATSSDEAVADAAQIKNDQLNKQKTIYEQMLPAIAAAEQAQLKFNQTLSLVQGPVNAFVNGLTEGLMGIIEGTKSAEEAFADMLKGMGQALMQQGAQMIAQYIAIGIARMFAGIPAADAGDGMNGGGILPQIANPGELPFGALAGERASGGPVSGGRPYIVGEEGQELFVPGKSGTIIPNDVFEATKAALIDSGDVVAADEEDETTDAIAANKSSIENSYTNIANAAAAKAAAEMQSSTRIGTENNNSNSTRIRTDNNNSNSNAANYYGDSYNAMHSATNTRTSSTAAAEYFGDSYTAMQNVNTTYSNRSATTMNEAQTAALQSAGTDTTIRYESVTINEVNYVTQEEAEKIGKRSAQAAKADVYRELRNRPAARSRVGV